MRRATAVVEFDGATSLQHEFDISPEEFLQQADDDFELGGNAARLNALSNAKRVIHSQIDEALLAVGFSVTRMNYPQKMQLLGELGFASPRVLRRVNNARNILEHEYQSPSPEQVEEAIDLAALFLGATKRQLERWECDFAIGNEGERIGYTFTNPLDIHFEDESKVYLLAGYKGVSPDPGAYGEPTLRGAQSLDSVQIEPRHDLFRDFVRLGISAKQEKKRVMS